MSQEEQKQIILKKLGENIRNLRIKKNLSQEELAFKINSARNFIGCIERAEKSPTIITLCRIAKALEVKVENLIYGIA
ncbi:MAG: helix-turn-helix domain-containing protein [Heliobacteriaceae bacterium]|jgi:transcriptional regulator with XRE-family HTH domain|nr:helix-turn-helix domain-containing protein [Heliobacteriaceae bacterium]